MPKSLRSLVFGLLGGWLVGAALLGCGCPDAQWSSVEIEADGDSLTEAKIRTFLMGVEGEAALSQLERLYKLRPASPAPPTLPEGYMGPQQWGLLRAMGASEAPRDICASICEGPQMHLYPDVDVICEAQTDEAGRKWVACRVKQLRSCP